MGGVAVDRGKRSYTHTQAPMRPRLGDSYGLVPIPTSMQPNSELRLGDTEHALPVMNCLTSRAHDYSKKSAVLCITTSD